MESFITIILVNDRPSHFLLKINSLLSHITPGLFKTTEGGTDVDGAGERSRCADRGFRRKHGFRSPDDLRKGEILQGEDDSVAGVVHGREKVGGLVAMRSDHRQ